jgi:hypothetical protein
MLAVSPFASAQKTMTAGKSILRSAAIWKRVYNDIDSSSCLVLNRFPLEILCVCACKDSARVRDSLCAAGHAFRNMRIKQGRNEFVREAIERAGNYPFIADTLEKYGLHPDLQWLPVLESGFLDTMISEAGAKGIWQFMGPTAARFGLSRDDITDSHKSTSAFAQYLSALLGEFNDYGLALTAYHHGERGVRAKLQKRNAADLETIAQDLGFESRNYYARFLSVLEIVHSSDGRPQVVPRR